MIHVKNMLAEIPSYADMVGNLTRVLRPGGLLVLVEPELSFVGRPPAALTRTGVDQRNAGAERRKVVRGRAACCRPDDLRLGSRNLRPVRPRGRQARRRRCGDWAVVSHGPLAPPDPSAPHFFFQETGCPVGPYMTGGEPAPRKALTEGYAPRVMRLMQASPTLRRAGAALAAVVGEQMASVLDAARFDGRREELRKLLVGCVREVSFFLQAKAEDSSIPAAATTSSGFSPCTRRRSVRWTPACDNDQVFQQHL